MCPMNHPKIRVESDELYQPPFFRGQDCEGALGETHPWYEAQGGWRLILLI